MIITGSREQMVKEAIRLLCERVTLLLQKKTHVVIALPGGRSVADIYRGFGQCDLPWNQLDIFLLDERLVPADHPESNYRLIKEQLGSAFPSDRIQPFRYDRDDSAQAVCRYQNQLEQCGGRFDIVLASSGEDGHIGSLFPHHHSIEQGGEGFFLVHDSPKPPAQRLTAGRRLISGADTGVVIFFGSGKGKALLDFLNPKLSYKDCPAKIILELPHHYLLTDQEVGVQ